MKFKYNSFTYILSLFSGILKGVSDSIAINFLSENMRFNTNVIRKGKLL